MIYIQSLAYCFTEVKLFYNAQSDKKVIFNPFHSLPRWNVGLKLHDSSGISRSFRKDSHHTRDGRCGADTVPAAERWPHSAGIIFVFYLALVLSLNKSKSFLSSVGMYSFDYFMSLSSRMNRLKVLSEMLSLKLRLLSGLFQGRALLVKSTCHF